MDVKCSSYSGQRLVKKNSYKGSPKIRHSLYRGSGVLPPRNTAISLSFITRSNPSTSAPLGEEESSRSDEGEPKPP